MQATVGYLNEDGNWVAVSAANPLPTDGNGGGGPVTVTWDDIEDKPAVIAAGDNAAGARTAIGAGTSNLAIGTTAGTAGDGAVLAGKAALASPALTGTPTAPTAAVSTSTTQLATTAFVQAATKSKTQTVALTPLADPATAELEDVATLLNAVIAALKA